MNVCNVASRIRLPRVSASKPSADCIWFSQSAIMLL